VIAKINVRLAMRRVAYKGDMVRFCFVCHSRERGNPEGPNRQQWQILFRLSRTGFPRSREWRDVASANRTRILAMAI